VSNDTTELQILDLSLLKVDTICLLDQQHERVARGTMTIKLKIVAVFSTTAVSIAALGAVADSVVRADDLPTAIYNGVNQLRQTCGPVGDDPRLRVAAQRQANDMVIHGVGGGHIGSDGSSPQARIAEAGYARPGYTGEIIYWGTGSLANPNSALDWWMASPAHRAVIVNCTFTAAGFAIAWAGDKMIAVGDFAGP
jgi:uncharacterized protein YkwD